MNEEKKIVIWCGNAPNQKALANKIAKKFTVAAIVLDERKNASAGRKISQLPSLLWDRFRFRIIYDTWKKLQQHYDNVFSSWPDVPILKVPDINDPATGEFTGKFQPALIAVSGTALVKKKLLDTPASIGIINLHTGLSPYMKGGPNCTNWCIANNDWHLVGNTIMWLNAGIDSGNIICSEHIDIGDATNFFEAHLNVMEHAHTIYVSSIDYLLNTQPPFNNVPQNSFGKGNLFLTKMWTAEKRKQLLKNWRNKRSRPKLNPPATVGLPSRAEGFAQR